MSVATRYLSIVGLLLGIWIVLANRVLNAASAQTPLWAAAHIETGTAQLDLFPLASPKATVHLPAELSSNVIVNAFGADGRTIYLQRASRPSEGIIRIQFNPLRQETVSGSAGLGSVWSLAAAAPSSRVLVSGMYGSQCGTFEIDSRAGVRRPVLMGDYPDCGGGGGAISPDGGRAARYAGGALVITDLANAKAYVVRGVRSSADLEDPSWYRRVAWSPDGHWISAIKDDGRIVLIDSDDTERRRDRGPAGGGPIEWSPDSRYMLAPRAQLRCALYLYFESLEAIDAETGKRILIKSSRCEVGPGWSGWIDSAIASQ